ncbi:MAG: hypothetical protein A2309_09210 [Bacteroidetes bacterium RIFOXYB2_FULL_35_7]|nr:MAG: hypothetical protein A2309_09210 [Bacteroidetes bacterium RIFOXYB2_FULL_35_7]
MYNFRNYTVQDGISQSTINNLFQDYQGFLWFSTQKGFVCFDGINFTNYTTKNGLPGNLVTFIYEDKTQIMWIATNEGLCKWDRKKFVTYTKKDNLPSYSVFSIFEEDNGTKIISTASGIIAFNGKEFINIIAPDSLLPVKKFFRTKNNQVLCATNKGLYFWKDGKILSDNKFQNFQHIIFNDFIEDNNGNIWCATSIGLLKISENKTIYQIESCAGKKIENITTDKQGTIWVGSEDGSFGYYDGKVFHSIGADNGISNLSIIDLFTDDENNLWIGGRNGLTKLPINNPFTHYTTFTKNEGIIILGLYRNPGNTLWAATYGNNIIGIKNNRFINYPLNLKDNRFFDLTQNTNNNFVLASASLGIIVYDTLSRKVIQTICPTEDTRVYSLFKDSKNNIWAGTSSSGVILLEKDETRIFTIEDGLLSNKVMSVGEDKTGNIWIGQIDGGISKFDGRKITSFRKENGFPASYVRAITCDENNRIFMGTATHGIVHVQEVGPGIKCSYVRENDGLNSDNIYFLRFDSKGFLWAGTEHGLNRISFNANGSVGEIKNYSEEEGFIYMETNINSFNEDNEGNLWFGNTSGITKYTRVLDDINTKEVRIYFTALKLFFENTDWKNYSDSINRNIPKNLKLPYDKNHLTFEFTGLCYTNPEKVKYKYKLEGQDDKWSPETKEHKAVFSNISPGTYTFLLLAANNDGIWNEEPVAFTFTILPPWWKKAWFVALCIVFLIATTLLIFYLRNRNLIKTKNILEQKVIERTAEVNQQKEEILSQHEFIEKKNIELKEQNLEIRAINHELTSSIKYAKRIQGAIMPTDELMNSLFEDYFIIYRPRDIVSGDFYWAAKVENKIVVSVADCTGHGVPGAFMSMLGTAFLNDIVKKEYITHPGVILRKLRKEIVRVLNQRGDSEHFEMQMKDGMDIAVVTIDPENLELQFAGANNPLYVASPHGMAASPHGAMPAFQEIRPDKMPISIYDVMDKFTNHELKYQKGDCLYLFSDGIIDQFGGPKGKKFKALQFKEILTANADKDMTCQKKELEKKLDDWINAYGYKHTQTDDIAIIGIRL